MSFYWSADWVTTTVLQPPARLRLRLPGW